MSCRNLAQSAIYFCLVMAKRNLLITAFCLQARFADVNKNLWQKEMVVLSLLHFSSTITHEVEAQVSKKMSSTRLNCHLRGIEANAGKGCC